jgi:hypothetical protein
MKHCITVLAAWLLMTPLNLMAQQSSLWEFCLRPGIYQCKRSCSKAGEQDCEKRCKKEVKQKCENQNLASLVKYLKELPSDDPADYQIDTSMEYQPVLGELYWLAPNPHLPKGVKPNKANNNVGIELFNDRLFVAFRTGTTHFAGKATTFYVVSTSDGKKWDKELELNYGKDIREPLFGVINGKLFLYFFEAGTNPVKFEPSFVYAMEWQGPGKWSKKVAVTKTKGEVFWSMKKRFGKLFVTSYSGHHYEVFGESEVNLHLKESTDGINFTHVGGKESVYYGGVSETGFEFDENGDLWAVTRNEDGDHTGFGSHVATANASDLSSWQFPQRASRRIYMSPKMFRHGDDLYLIGRRNLGSLSFGFMPRFLPMFMQRIFNWGKFTTSAKTTALFKIDKEKREVVHVMDLPGAGDTAFPTIRRLDEHTFLIANYTSPPDRRGRWWIHGQLTQTGIYMTTIEFVPKKHRLISPQE